MKNGYNVTLRRVSLDPEPSIETMKATGRQFDIIVRAKNGSQAQATAQAENPGCRVVKVA